MNLFENFDRDLALDRENPLNFGNLSSGSATRWRLALS